MKYENRKSNEENKKSPNPESQWSFCGWCYLFTVFNATYRELVFSQKIDIFYLVTLNQIWPTTLTYKYDLHNVKVNCRAKYPGQRSFHLKVINKHTDTHSWLLHYMTMHTCTHACMHARTNTHTTVLRLFFQDHPGEPVPEEIFFWTFMVQGKITEADTIHLAERHPIRTNQRPTSIIPSFLHRMPFLLYAGCSSTLSWLGTGTKYAGLHTQWRCYMTTNWTVNSNKHKKSDKQPRTCDGSSLSYNSLWWERSVKQINVKLGSTKWQLWRLKIMNWQMHTEVNQNKRD